MPYAYQIVQNQVKQLSEEIYAITYLHKWNETMKINWRPTHKTRKIKKLNQKESRWKDYCIYLKKEIIVSK